MFKKFNHQLNHSPVGSIWGINLALLVSTFFVILFPGQFIIPKNEIVLTLLFMSIFFTLAISTFILFTGEIKQVNVTYVCPTARQYMSEQEISKIEENK